MCVCAHVHTHMCACIVCQGLQRPEESIESLEQVLEAPCECWEPNLAPLEEQQALLTAKPSQYLYFYVPFFWPGLELK